MSVNDFNLAFCGLATAAVGLGYVCGRRLSGSRSPLPADLHAKKTPKELEAGLPANEPSVGQKRKRMDHDFDEVKSDLGYPHNLKQIYPHKRMRTPTPPPEPASELSVPVGASSSVEVPQVHQETAIVVDQQTTGETQVVSPAEQAAASELVSRDDHAPLTQEVAPAATASRVEPALAESSALEVHARAEGSHEKSENASAAAASHAGQVNMAAEVETQNEVTVSHAEAPASPKPAASEGSEELEVTSEKANTAVELARPRDVASKPMTIEAGPSTPPSEPTTSTSASSPKLFPAFQLKSPSTRPKTPETPKPTSSRGRGFAAFAGSASPFAKLATPKSGSSTAPAWASPNAADSNGPPAWVDPTSSAWAERKTGSPVAKEAVALEPQVYTAPVAHGYSTGEEDEDATLEIRAVRLYTKRGSKGFSEGVVGTMKVLRHKETQKQRLLFRRDPLFQVTMNVRVQEGMRCVYDEKERVVRIVTREPSSNGSPEIVIYAMKPSRSCTKKKFGEFGEALATLVGAMSTA
ncbi:hypothetical protein K525DRAFT_274106 [Schizophyllum commune Loenen D]|nr:hypothetical protein K525DRAFT_274106 [Schizophyllum commune Loenen D]